MKIYPPPATMLQILFALFLYGSDRYEKYGLRVAFNMLQNRYKRYS